MPIFKPTCALAGILLASLVSVMVISPAHATPWADSDDVQVRHNLQILADAGVVNLSVSTYPLMWGALIEVLQGLDTRNLRPHERNAYMQVMAALEFHRQGGYTGGQISGQSNNDAERGFGQRQHEKGAIEITRELKGDHSAFRLQTAWRTGRETRFGRQDKQELSFAGSYLATVVTSEVLGSWVLSADQLYTWWSPSYENDGMHTRSARPLHALRLTRAGASPSNLPLLKWLGPWSATAYAGRSERLVGVPELVISSFDALASFDGMSDILMGDMPAAREEAFGIRVTANPHRSLQLGARFTGAHLVHTSKNAAIDARVVLPKKLTAGQLAVYGELITHQSDIDDTYHTLGADYSFAFGGAVSGGASAGTLSSTRKPSAITNARVYAEHLYHQQKETIALGYSQFNTAGFGIDVRLRNIRYHPNYYRAIDWQNFTYTDGANTFVSAQALQQYLAGRQERQQADITFYVPLREGRLSAGVQAWRDSYRTGAGAAAVSGSGTATNDTDINVFLNWEIRW